ncbi:amidophosphoribosyltransferase [Silvanigrella aquatica]|uniref:Amidophosphoribosyltransferase n=1 Tax=Silvanigrella aquatica TaxID=1915309 RepID=A0A1L4CZM6_9BACT|nr:amidophosphoribosyltransferase [Silvanigrella aquatica]APJ03396.1 amidophosphoribosyltransferase [Silvanigrella aquatica]
MCGVFGVTNTENASKIAYLGLFALQHRGQESAGISCTDENVIHTHRNAGLVSDVFKEEQLVKLEGNHALGHVRYSTAGGNIGANIQPLTARIGGIPVSLSHNGNIVNSDELRTHLENSGAILQATADTELILHIMARSNKATFLEKLMHSFEELCGAFSLLILTPTHLYAVVDACGYRPLSLGKLKSSNGLPSWVLSSETCAMDLVGATFIRDIAPGEILSIELATGERKSHYFNLTAFQSLKRQHAKCIFEHVYFARPDSLVWNILANDARFAMGEALAKNNPVDADMVIAVPDSGVPMAMGYAHASGIPYKIGLIRNHYVGRTFIEPTQNVRNFKVRLKLNPVRETVRGKKVVVIDDSIVRGTTSRKIIELLYEAGAKEVHMRIASPPVKYPCYYGIDTPKRKELLAQIMTPLEMNDHLKSETLAFLSEEQLIAVMQKFQQKPTLQKEEKENGGWCTACFTGNYQDEIAQTKGYAEKREVL